MNRCAMLALAAAALPVPAFAQTQPAVWATDAREPLCVFDGLMDETLGQPDAARISAECQQRFGWTEHQAAGGVAAGYLWARALLARDEAVAAGVGVETIGQIMGSFDASERALLVPVAGGSQENARRFARLLRDRVTAAGLRGEARDKAAHAIIAVMTASNMVSDFAREIGAVFNP